MDTSTAHQRKVRKGTHSCRECRLRKVKCIYREVTDASCVVCERRKTRCISQSASGVPTASQPIIKGLEQNALPVWSPNNRRGGPAVDSAHRLSTPAPSSTSHDSAESLTTSMLHHPCPGQNTHQQYPSLDQHPRQTAMLTQLLTPEDVPPTPASNALWPAETGTHSEIRHHLLRALPSQADIRILSQKVDNISVTTYQSHYRSRFSTPILPNDLPKAHITVSSLLHPEMHPVLLARQMLLIAAALQDLSPKTVIPGLSKHHHKIMQNLAESAIMMVTTNDALLGTLEGLENVILECFYHLNCGNVRRAWITMRRAVMCAQLMGLHRSGPARFAVIGRCGLDPDLMWMNVACTERILSLLLGLPSSTLNTSLAQKDATSDALYNCNLPAILGNATARIIERNQIEVCQQAKDRTMEIDRELIEIADHMPPSFWRPPDFSGLECDSSDAFVEIRRTFDHCAYYTLVMQLHLPHMLCPQDASQRVYSTIACVNASREILMREITLRTFSPVAACCRMSDFVAPIAGMTLMLAHAVSHCGKASENLLVHQRLADRALVERALECMKFMSELQEDLIAVKCAAVLKDLLTIEENAASAQKRGVNQSHGESEDPEDGLKIFIMSTFNGGIKISKGGIAAVEPLGSEQHRSLPEGVSIGGIGTIRVCTPNASDSGVEPVMSITTSTPRGGITHTAEAMSDDILMQQDQFFGDAAVGTIDWAFQGIDTAFFESLMRGAGDLQLDGADIGGGTWDPRTVIEGRPKT